MHWAPPEELTTFAPTAAEQELSEALKGPSASWTTDAHPVEAQTPRAEFDAQEATPEDLVPRLSQLSKITASPK